MFHAKFECPSMNTAWDRVLSTQEYSVHAHLFVCLILVRYAVTSYRYGVGMFHTKFENLGMYTAWDVALSTQEYCVHAH